MRNRRPSWLAGLGFFLILLSFHSFHGYSLDEVQIYGMSVGFLERGRFSLKPNNDALWTVPVPGEENEGYPVYPPGVSAVMALFLLPALGLPAPAPYAAATLIGPFLGAALLLLLARRLGTVRALIIFLGTPLWFYSRTHFSEPLRTLLLLAAVFFLFDRRRSSPLLAGSCLAASLLVRLDTALLAPLFLFFLRPKDANTRDAWRSFALYLGPLILGALLFAALNHVRFGSAGTTGYEGYRSNTASTVVMQFFFFAERFTVNMLSPGRGLLIFAPLAFLGFRRPRGSRETLLLLLAVVSILFYSQFSNWRSAWDWGPRYLHLAWTALAILATESLAASPRPSRIAILLCFLWGLGINLLAVGADYTLHYARVNDTIRHVLDPAAWPPLGQVQSLALGAWDLPLWTKPTWGLGATALLTGFAALVLERRWRVSSPHEG